MLFNLNDKMSLQGSQNQGNHYNSVKLIVLLQTSYLGQAILRKYSLDIFHSNICWKTRFVSCRVIYVKKQLEKSGV